MTDVQYNMRAGISLKKFKYRIFIKTRLKSLHAPMIIVLTLVFDIYTQ